MSSQDKSSKSSLFRTNGWSDSEDQPEKGEVTRSPELPHPQSLSQGSLPANSDCAMVIMSPKDELPPLTYAVNEEQPPYSTGHQNLRTFTKIFIHNIDFQISRDALLRVFC